MTMKWNLKIAVLALVLCATVFVSCKKDKEEEEPVTYTVTFDANGGSPSPAALNVKAGDKATAPQTNPVKADYIFLFWYQNDTAKAYDFNTPVNANMTLHARWQDAAQAEYWQVSWELNGGAWPASGDNHATQVVKGGTLAEPVAPTKTGNTFEGWYKEAAFTNKINFPYSATSDFKLYAKWTTSGGNEKTGFYIGDTRYEYFGDAFREVQGTTAVITVYSSSDYISSCFLSENTHITIEGVGSGERIFKIGSGSNFFEIREGASLTLKNITLDADEKNKSSLIEIESGGTFIMLEGTKIKGNRYNDGSGGGVYVDGGGNFIMKGGIITENHVPNLSGQTRVGVGGGVYVRGTMEIGTFTMEGGEITGNIASGGGGVYLNGGNFIMKGGRIYDNTTPTGSKSNLGISAGTAVYGDGTPILEKDGDIIGKTK